MLYEEFLTAPESVFVTEVSEQYNEFKSPLYSENNWEWVTVFTLSDHSEDFVVTTEEPEWDVGQLVLYQDIWNFYNKHRSY